MPLKIGTTSIKIPFAKAYLGNALVYQKAPATRTISYYGTATNLSVNKCPTYGANSNYAIFGVAYEGNTDYHVDAYDSSLTKTGATEIRPALNYALCAWNNNFVLVGGGNTGSIYQNAVISYDNSLTQSTAPNLSDNKCNGMGTNFLNYAIFAGGNLTGSPKSKTVDAYDLLLTKTQLTDLSVAREAGGITANSNYLIVAGGSTGSRVNVVDVYNTSLTKVATSVTLSNQKEACAGASVDKYILFGGGKSGSTYYQDVDVFDDNLTKTTLQLTNSVSNLSGVSSQSFAIFAGGIGSSVSKAVDLFDKNLTKSATQDLTTGRASMGSAKIDKYILFAGGRINASSTQSVVEVYQEI